MAGINGCDACVTGPPVTALLTFARNVRPTHVESPRTPSLRSAPCDYAPSLADFDASVRAHFARLAVASGVSGSEAASLSLRLAAQAAAPPVRPAAVSAACAALTASLAVGGPAEASARANLLSAAAELFDPDALSRSFLLPASAHPVPPTPQAPTPALAVARLSVDAEAARECFQWVECSRVACPALDAPLQAALNAALLRLQAAAQAPAGCGGALRCALLLLLACPALRDPSYHAPLRRLCDAIVQLPAPHRRCASLALAALPGPEFAELLQALQGALLARFYEHLDRPAQLYRAVGGLVGCLGVLFEANALRGAGEQLGAECFWNDALNGSDWTADGGHPRHGQSLLAADYGAWAAELAAQGAAGDAAAAAAAAAPPRAASSHPSSFCHAPWLYAPATKARILAIECAGRQRAAFSGAVFRTFLDATACPFLVLRVRRERVVRDALRELNRRRAELHKPLKVVFLGEEGVDEGGPTREFFTCLTRCVFSPDSAMFVAAEEQHRCLWFAPGACAQAGKEEEYELTGTVLALAAYNGTLLELAFPRLVYKLLQGGVPAFEDLRDVAPTLHRSLTLLLAADPASVADMALTFEASYTPAASQGCAAPAAVSDELVPGGRELCVTGDNVRHYVAAYADWLLTRSVARECDAFRRGFARLAHGPALRLFRPEELEQLLCGSEELDFQALEGGATYGDGAHPGDDLCRSFWRVAHALNPQQKKRLLAFVTGSDRVPIGGLGALAFRIQRNGDGDVRLPTASTCFNTLLLPKYSTDQFLRQRLLLALDNSEGFGLR